MALASALEKISSLSKRTVNEAAERAPAMAHMYISNPLSGARMDNLFSTHPNVENRIKALTEIASSVRGGGGGQTPRQRVNPIEAKVRPGQSWRTPGTRPRSDDDKPLGPWG